MANHARQLPSQAITYLAIIMSCVMAAILIKAPHEFLTYLLIATPFIFLFAVWGTYRRFAAEMDLMNVGQLRSGDGPTAGSLRDRLDMIAIFALSGIAIALATGFTLGRISVR